MSSADCGPRSASEALAGTSVFVSLIGVTSAALLLLSRLGLETPPRLVLAGTSLLVAAACAPFLLPGTWRRRLEAAPFVFSLLTLAIVLSPLLAFWTGSFLLFVYPVAAVLGLARAIGGLRRMHGWELALLLTCAPLVGAYLFSQSYKSSFAHVFTPEYARLEILALDTVFHTAISHLIQGFGQASTGLDGLVPFRYHTGSHTWFASIGRLTGTPPLFSYPIGLVAVVLPALFGSVFVSTTCIQSRQGSSPTTSLFAALALLLLFDRIGWYSYYFSESYAFGLIALLCSLPLVLDLLDGRERGRVADLARLAAALLLVAVACWMKVSVGVILGVAFGFAVLRARGLCRRSTLFLASLGVIGLVCLRSFTAKTGLPLSESFSLFNFYRSAFPIGFDARKAHSSLVLPIVFLALTAWKLFVSRSPAVGARRERSVRRSQLIALTTLVAHAPGLLLVMWASTAWWFANVAQWLALPMLIAEFDRGSVASLEWRWIRRGGALLAGIWIATALSHLEVARFHALASRLLVPRQLPGELEGHVRARQLMRATWSNERRLFGAQVQDRLQATQISRLADLVGRARLASDPSQLIVFLPPDNAEYWDGRGDFVPCMVRPLRIPSLTGVPLLKGLHPRCHPEQRMRAYGYAEYGAASVSRPLADASVCELARQGGFTRVLVLRSIDHAERNSLLDCPSSDREPPS